MRIFWWTVIYICLACNATDRFVQEADLSGQYLDVNNTTLFVNQCGTGEPLIIIHGGPGLNHSYFLPHFLGLSDYFHLIFYDQRASGQSSGEGIINFQAFIQDIEGIRKKLGLAKIHVLGHSWGALLALQYALQYEEQVSSLILLNASAPSTELQDSVTLSMDSTKQQFYQQRLAKIQASNDFQNRKSPALEAYFKTVYQAQFYDTVRIDDLQLNLPANFFENSLRLSALNEDLIQYNWLPDIKELEVPTFIVYGVSEPAAEILGPVYYDAIPSSQLLILPRSGHFPFIEQPTRLFKEIIEFISSDE